MNRKMHLLKHFGLSLLLIVFLASSSLPVHAAPVPAPVKGIDTEISEAIPGFKLLAGLFARNRTYRSVEDYIDERNAHYDQLLAAARQEYIDYKNASIEGNPDAKKPSLRKSQLAGYLKQVALIQAERASAMQFAEAIKKGARKDFTQAVKEELKNRLMATGMVKRVFSAVTSGFGQAQQFIDVAISKLDKGGPVDMVVRKLRTVTLRLDQASALLGGPFMGEIRQTLSDLSDKIEHQAQLTKEELNQTKKEMKTFTDKLKDLQASGQLPVGSETVLEDLGMELAGLGAGTPATQAVLNLITRRGGVSSQEVRDRGMAFLQAGYAARCRAKGDAMKEAWKKLNEEAGLDVKTEPPGENCDEINTNLLTSNSEVPEARAPAADQGMDPADKDFSAAGCECGGFKVTDSRPWGNASITCGYEWVGTSGVTNRLSFDASRIYHLDEQMPVFEKNLEDLVYKGSHPDADQTVTEFEKSSSDYGMVITGPGGISSTTNQPIPMCGNGNGAYAYGEEFLITTSLFACDLGSEAQNYVDALNTLATCAMNAIDSKYLPQN